MNQYSNSTDDLNWLISKYDLEFTIEDYYFQFVYNLKKNDESYIFPLHVIVYLLIFLKRNMDKIPIPVILFVVLKFFIIQDSSPFESLDDCVELFLDKIYLNIFDDSMIEYIRESSKEILQSDIQSSLENRFYDLNLLRKDNETISKINQFLSEKKQLIKMEENIMDINYQIRENRAVSVNMINDLEMSIEKLKSLLENKSRKIYIKQIFKIERRYAQKSALRVNKIKNELISESVENKNNEEYFLNQNDSTEIVEMNGANIIEFKKRLKNLIKETFPDANLFDSSEIKQVKDKYFKKLSGLLYLMKKNQVTQTIVNKLTVIEADYYSEMSEIKIENKGGILYSDISTIEEGLKNLKICFDNKIVKTQNLYQTLQEIMSIKADCSELMELRFEFNDLYEKVKNTEKDLDLREFEVLMEKLQ